MSTDRTYQINSPSTETTETLAALLGAKLRGGEVIALSSDLGGGKTAFVRGLSRGLGSSDHVSSPTFTIGREYRAPHKGLTLHHFDFYRLWEPGLMIHELTEVLNDPHAVVAVEWGNIVEGVLPDEKLAISISRIGENERRIVITYPQSLAYLIPEVTTC